MSLGGASVCLTVATVGAILSYIPVGSVASRVGRKRTILFGVVLLTGCFFAMFLYTLICDAFHPALYALFALVGIAWAAINVNSLPMRQAAAEQILREDAIRRLTELAFGRANDAVKLAAALSTGETSELERLELSSVGELKLTDKGVEIKFIDRVRALEALCGLLGDGSQKDAAEFFRALEDAGEGV